MPLGSLERRLDSTETTGGLPNFPSLPVKIYFFVMCTHVIHDDNLCTFFRDLRYFFSWLKCSQRAEMYSNNTMWLFKEKLFT